MPAELARAIVHRFRGREMTALGVAGLLDGTGHEPGTVLAQLEAAGYMEKVETALLRLLPRPFSNADNGCSVKLAPLRLLPSGKLPAGEQYSSWRSAGTGRRSPC